MEIFIKKINTTIRITIWRGVKQLTVKNIETQEHKPLDYGTL